MKARVKLVSKILDFESRAIINTIAVNTDAYCDASNDYQGEDWPYEYISSIVPSPDGTKIIVSSKKMKTRIIDLNTGTLLQEFGSGAVVGITLILQRSLLRIHWQYTVTQYMRALLRACNVHSLYIIFLKYRAQKAKRICIL